MFRARPVGGVQVKQLFAVLAAVSCLSACEDVKEKVQTLIPPRQDGGIVTVPGSYHSARMTPGHKEHLSLTGEKKLECHDCHAIADAGFVAPALDLCASCHKDQMAQHHPFDGGVMADGGEAMGCLTCHVFRADTDTARFQKWACMNCHTQDQGVKGAKPAITVHLEGCNNCHRPHLVPFTQAADCTTCHDVTLKHGAKGDTVAEKCMNCHPHHSAAVVASGKCVTCHTKPDIEARARVSPGALFEKGHVGCGTCHTAHTFQKDAVKACTGCHTTQHVLAPNSHKQCISCHQPHADRAAPRSCESCHKKELAALKHPPQKDTGLKCAGCHMPHPKTADAPIAKSCVSCHDKAPFTNDVVHAATTSCDACHVPHGGKPKAEVLCAKCHEVQTTAVKKNKGHQKCADCHAGLPHGERSAPKACLSCHEKKVPPQKGHKECASCHASHSATVLKTCVQCHVTPTSPALPGLHAVEKHRDCKTCHAPHLPQPGFGPASCITCHEKLPKKDHPTPPASCIGCHLFKTQQ